MIGERINLAIERERDALFVDVTGRIDGATAIEFEEGVRNAIAETDRCLVIDFRDLAHIDSAGLRVVLAAAKFLVARNGRLMLCNFSNSIHNQFELMGFDKIVPIHPTRDAARASVPAELTGE